MRRTAAQGYAAAHLAERQPAVTSSAPRIAPAAKAAVQHGGPLGDALRSNTAFSPFPVGDEVSRFILCSSLSEQHDGCFESAFAVMQVSHGRKQLKTEPQQALLISHGRWAVNTLSVSLTPDYMLKSRA